MATLLAKEMRTAGSTESSSAVAASSAIAVELVLDDALRVDPTFSCVIDTWASVDDGRRWQHRHREYWEGGPFTSKDGRAHPRPSTVAIGVPAGCLYRVTVDSRRLASYGIDGRDV